MNKKEKAKLREELEKESLTARQILTIRRFHSEGYTVTKISEGTGFYESTIIAALARDLTPVPEEEEGDGDDEDED
jgi:hypothetical protein